MLNTATITLLSTTQSIQEVKVDYQPLPLESLLVGQSKTVVLEKMEQLFSLCKNTHLHLASHALGLTSHITQQVLWQEWVNELSWNLFQQLNKIGEQQALAVTAKLRQGDMEAGTLLFGASVQEWLSYSKEQLIQWSTTEAPYAQLIHHLLQPDYYDFGNRVESSGSIARQHQHSLLITFQKETNADGKKAGELFLRTLARMIELATLLVTPDAIQSLTQANSMQKFWTTEAPRGQLSHRFILDGDIIKGCTLTTPTDQHCQQGNVLCQALQHQPLSSTLAIELLVLTIDPCVPYQIKQKKVETEDYA